MPLTLEQYADYLDTRDLAWPAAPDVETPKAKPHLVRMPEVRVVVWNVYGTLVNILSGDVLFEHPTKFIMDLALDKTLQEFKMWGSMYRKPGPPADSLGAMYRKLLAEQRMAPSPGEKYPEILTEVIWEELIKKLFQKDYKFDVNFFGSLNEYSRKVAYFFYASLQGTSCYDGAAEALTRVKDAGLKQGLLGNGQCFTTVQLQRGIARQDSAARIESLVQPGWIALSHAARARKPSEALFRKLLAEIELEGIAPEQILHVGNSIENDIIPAKKLGLRTALVAQDKSTLAATKDQLKGAATRPDMLLTELPQIAHAISPE